MPDWLVYLAAAVVYFAPSILAENRGTANLGGVFIVNLFTGWTMIGWVVAFAWAMSGETRKEKAQRLQN